MRTVPESEAQLAVSTVKTKGKKPKRSASAPKRAEVSHTETDQNLARDFSTRHFKIFDATSN